MFFSSIWECLNAGIHNISHTLDIDMFSPLVITSDLFIATNSFLLTICHFLVSSILIHCYIFHIVLLASSEIHYQELPLLLNLYPLVGLSSWLQLTNLKNLSQCYISWSWLVKPWLTYTREEYADYGIFNVTGTEMLIYGTTALDGWLNSLLPCDNTQRATWLSQHYFLNLNFSFLNWIFLLLILTSYSIVLMSLNEPLSRSKGRNYNFWPCQESNLGCQNGPQWLCQLCHGTRQHQWNRILFRLTPHCSL